MPVQIAQGNTQVEKSYGSMRKAAGCCGQTARFAGAAMRNALSVVLSVMLVLTMNPFTGSGTAIASTEAAPTSEMSGGGSI